MSVSKNILIRLKKKSIKISWFYIWHADLQKCCHANLASSSLCFFPLFFLKMLQMIFEAGTVFEVELFIR